MTDYQKRLEAEVADCRARPAFDDVINAVAEQYEPEATQFMAALRAGDHAEQGRLLGEMITKYYTWTCERYLARRDAESEVAA